MSGIRRVGRKTSKYYKHCKKNGKCSRYGCRRKCADIDGHVYTKCSTHRERDRILQEQYRSTQPSAAAYRKWKATAA